MRSTILDLFDSEDWWAPFRSRGAALVTAGRTLAARMDKGDKRMPLPDAAMLERAQTAGVASGVLIGDSALIVAVVPVGAARRGDSTYLCWRCRSPRRTSRRRRACRVMLSDGTRPISVAGSASQQSALSRLVGRESGGQRARSGVDLAGARDRGGAQAVAVGAAPDGGRRGAPTVFRCCSAVVALVLGGAAFVLRRKTGGAASGAADEGTAAAGGSGIQALAVPELRPRRRASSNVAARSPTTRPRTWAIVPPRSPRAGSRRSAARCPPGAPASRVAPRRLAADALPARVETGSSTFGRYRLLQRLGEGGMAELYTAVLHGAEGFRRVYVVKRLRPEVARNRAAVEQFIDEAKLGSTLVHSNIVPVFDFGKVGDEYFLAQEYIIGRDLGKVMQRQLEQVGHPLSERLVLYIVHEVLEALAYAHNRTDAAGNPIGLVHRDISPGNVMVTARGEVKLFDFGIVKGEGRVSKTEVGVVKGNVSFMSPEQARGQTVDARSDLFSLGLVLYYGLTGEQLYPGQSTFDQLMRAADGTEDGAAQAPHRAAAGVGDAGVARARRRSGLALPDGGRIRGRGRAAHRGRQGGGGGADAEAVRRRVQARERELVASASLGARLGRSRSSGPRWASPRSGPAPPKPRPTVPSSRRAARGWRAMRASGQPARPDSTHMPTIEPTLNSAM